MRSHNLLLLISILCLALGVLFLVVQFVKDTKNSDPQCKCNYKFVNRTKQEGTKCTETYEVQIYVAGDSYSFDTSIICNNCACARGFNCDCQTDLFAKCAEISTVASCANDPSESYLIGSYVSFPASGVFIILSFYTFLRQDHTIPTYAPTTQAATPTATDLHVLYV